MPPLWASDDIYPRFKARVDLPYLHVASPACNGFVRLTSGMTPADLLAAIIAAEQFQYH